MGIIDIYFHKLNILPVGGILMGLLSACKSRLHYSVIDHCGLYNGSIEIKQPLISSLGVMMTLYNQIMIIQKSGLQRTGTLGAACLVKLHVVSFSETGTRYIHSNGQSSQFDNLFYWATIWTIRRSRTKSKIQNSIVAKIYKSPVIYIFF